MTFYPTAKADLASLDTVWDDWQQLGQQVLSRLHHAEADATWAAMQIAELSSQLAAQIDEDWIYASTSAGSDPGAGKLAIHPTVGENREFAISEVSIGGQVDLSGLDQGSAIVLTDDPAAPPVTAFRQYVVTSTPVDHGSWVSFSALRVAVFGIPSVPVGTQVRMILR